MINISNFQKLAIFCLLVVAALGNPPPGYADVDEFREFINLVKDVAAKKEFPVRTWKYGQLDLLDKVEPEFKHECLKEFNALLADKRENQNIYKKVLKKVKKSVKPKYAYTVLDNRCKCYVEKIICPTIIRRKYEITWQFEVMLRQGNFIQFLAYKNNHNITYEEMQEETKKLMYTYHGMEKNEAEFLVIIHKYDSGILGDYYPNATPSNEAAKMTTTTSKAYITIERRLNEFQAKITDVIDNGNFPHHTLEYNEINRLDEVEHDFKLECLRLVYKIWSEEEAVIEYEPQDAYIALDKACKDYVGKLNNMIIKYAPRASKILEKENCIEFLVQKNQLSLAPEKIEEVYEELKIKYKNMEYLDAEYWAILLELNQYKEIIGKYFP